MKKELGGDAFARDDDDDDDDDDDVMNAVDQFLMDQNGAYSMTTGLRVLM